MRHGLALRALHLAMRLLVLAILGFVLLPSVVVVIAAFNDRAILAFPPTGFFLALVSPRPGL